MKIRFSEHITQSHREGIFTEIGGMGATAEQIDEDWYFITATKPALDAFAVEFLRGEQRMGNLEIDESFMR